MRIKKVTLSLLVILLTSCVDFSDNDYETTSFYVKNTSNKTITFTAGVLKMSQITDPYVVTNTFTVNPNDSVLARNTNFKKNGTNPQSWFRSFEISPVSGVEMNDPKLPENWKKYENNDTPIYVFTLNKTQ